jgi:hypothetical protein
MGAGEGEKGTQLFALDNLLLILLICRAIITSLKRLWQEQKY